MDYDDEHPPPWKCSQCIIHLKQTNCRVWEPCFNKAIKKREGRWKPWLNISACQKLSQCPWYLCWGGEIIRLYIRHRGARPKLQGVPSSWTGKAVTQTEGCDGWTVRVIFFSTALLKGLASGSPNKEHRRELELTDSNESLCLSAF